MAAISGQRDHSQPAFVIDGHGGPIGHGLGDVVNIDILAKQGRGVDVAAFDGGAGEANKGGVGQGRIEWVGGLESE